MSSAINQDVLKTIQNGVKFITLSMATPMILTIDKKKINKKTGRDNYCKTVLLLWGFMQYDLDQLDDDMFNRVLLVSTSVLNKVLSRKELKPFFPGVDLSPNPNEEDHSKLSYEMCSWFHKNDSLPGVQIMTITGKHLFALGAFADKLKKEHTEAFYKNGSLIEEGKLGMNVMQSILIDNKIKFNF